MSWLSAEGATSKTAAQWAGPLIAALIGLVGLIGGFGVAERAQGVTDQRLTVIEQRQSTAAVDHDLLISMHAQLDDIESMLKGR